MLRPVLALAIGLFLGTPQFAAEPSSTPAAEANAPHPSPTGKWSLSVTRNADGAATVTATLPADTPIPSGFGQTTPSLVLRYHAGQTAAYVVFDTFLGHDAIEATVTFGDAASETRRWRLSNDGRAAIAPGDALAFIDRLKHASTFSIGVRPPKTKPVSTSFSLRGIDLVVKTLLSAGVKYSG